MISRPDASTGFTSGGVTRKLGVLCSKTHPNAKLETVGFNPHDTFSDIYLEFTDAGDIIRLETLSFIYPSGQLDLDRNGIKTWVTVRGGVFSGQFAAEFMTTDFGSVNPQVLDEVRSIATLEGILVKPVYTAKHFATARHIIEIENLNGNILLINSGRSLSLAGFQHKLWGACTACGYKN